MSITFPTSDLRPALPWLTAVAGMFFLNFGARVIFPPLFPAIEADMGFSHAEAARMLLIFSVGYSVSLFFSGAVACHMRHRTMVCVSTFCMGLVMLLTGLCHDEWLLFAGLLLFGVFGGWYLPSGLATLTSLIDPQHYGRAMAIHEVAPNLSFILTPLLAETVLRVADWRAVLMLFGTLMMVAALVFFKWGRGGEMRGAPLRVANARRLVVRPTFWALLCLFAVAVGASMGPYAMLPLFLHEIHDYTRSQANQLLAVSRLSGPVMVLFAGVATDRLGARRTIAVYLIFSAITTAALGYAQGWWLVAATVLQPLSSVIFFPAGFAYISRLFAEEDRGLAISLIVPAAIVIGNGLVPLALGWMGDRHWFHLGFYSIGALACCGLLLVRLLEESPAAGSPTA
ncbi:MFS transporter [Megalodesulfovibrio gigas]|uniref:Putative narK gene product n=1 Tax=Megalodesulfovibrio gigas (strain ATCC 19364 / DSM 1382 / NCIMB 9332 / VKM B-1759) TaxID=1121448 RepID=T2GD98_MEGG1|nr:MFS transporter [Megalodesulfovibrio gigas]AGW13897.1 putative narK gene product [Megalodesulfovibrio gigas DSM 1382 = ATCC 19364]